jgi:hypothetical protein
MLIEVRAGEMRVRISQEESSNSPEYVETMLRLAGDSLMNVQRETYAIAGANLADLDDDGRERVRQRVMAQLAEEDFLDDDDLDESDEGGHEVV